MKTHIYSIGYQSINMMATPAITKMLCWSLAETHYTTSIWDQTRHITSQLSNFRKRYGMVWWDSGWVYVQVEQCQKCIIC